MANKALDAATVLGSAELLLVLRVAVHEALWVPGNVGHGTVWTIQVELDRPNALGKAGGVLGFVEDPPLR